MYVPAVETENALVAIGEGLHDAAILGADLAVHLEATGLRVLAIDAIVCGVVEVAKKLSIGYHDILER